MSVYRINKDYLSSAFRDNMFGVNSSIDNGTSPREICVDESIPNHFVQIIFALKESDDTWENNKWPFFTKETLEDIIENQYSEDSPELIDELNDQEFRDKYPEEIQNFLDKVCEVCEV